MKKHLRKVAFVATILILSPSPLSAQREVDRLRIENAALMKTVDSLQRIVDRSRFAGEEILFPWDNLLSDEDIARADYLNGLREKDKARAEVLSKIDFRLRVPYNDIISRHIDYYEKKAKYMEGVTQRFDRWNPYFTEVFTRYGIPEDITALAIVESAMNNRARSRAGAVGTWQLMPETATAHGLTVNFFNDERMDTKKATEVAAKYLAASFRTFGDWRLAVLSYNCGPGNVEKAVKKAGSSEVWDIYPYLPKETQGYLPALLAVLHHLKTR